MSEKFNQFLNQIVIYSAIAMGISLLMLVAGIRTWYGVSKAVGITSLLTGIVYFIIPAIKTAFFSQIPEEARAALQPILESFLGIISPKLLFVLILGTTLTILGFLGAHFSKSKKESEVKDGKLQKT